MRDLRRETKPTSLPLKVFGYALESVFCPEEHRRVCMLRRVLSEMNPPDAMELLTNRLRKTKSNAEFLMSIKE